MSKKVVINALVVALFLAASSGFKPAIASDVWVVVSEANYYPYNYWEKGKRTGLTLRSLMLS